MTLFVGSIPTISAGDTTTLPTNLATYRDALKALSEAWTTYNPAWTATTTNPTIGNGTITGKYAQINKLVVWRFIITCGSTTTFGSGSYLVSLPVACHADYVQNDSLNGNGATAQSGASAYSLGLVRYTTSSVVYFSTPSGTAANPTTPFTFVSGSILSGGGMYEAA